MNDLLHNLPVLWMTVVVFAFSYLVGAAIYLMVVLSAVGERARSFKALSPGMLPPLGFFFGLFVAFTAAQVWSDGDKANSAVLREATALSAVVTLASSFPGDPEARLRALVRRHIEEAATQEWPMMASRAETLSLSSRALTDAVRLTLGLAPSNSGQQIAQREIITALGNALDARQQRIVISRSEVNFIKWSCLFLLAVCALIAIVMVHSDNRLTAMIASGMFATGVAASALLILAHDRPFTGQISISATPLMQVMPELAESTK
jgi:uncharacterized MnhB-related membrane protein